MEDKKNIDLSKSKDILEEIEIRKTEDFINEYKEICKKYNRFFVPLLDINKLVDKQDDKPNTDSIITK